LQAILTSESASKLASYDLTIEPVLRRALDLPGYLRRCFFGRHSALITDVNPPRAIQREMTVIRRGLSSAPRSSQILLVTSFEKDPLVSIGVEVKLERLELDANLVRDVLDRDLGKIRMPGDRAQRRKLMVACVRSDSRAAGAGGESLENLRVGHGRKHRESSRRVASRIGSENGRDACALLTPRCSLLSAYNRLFR